jgi:hypothetical protein
LHRPPCTTFSKRQFYARRTLLFVGPVVIIGGYPGEHAHFEAPVTLFGGLLFLGAALVNLAMGAYNESRAEIRAG